MAINQFKSRRKAKRLLYSPATVIVLIIVTVILAHSAWDVYGKYRLSQDRLSQADGQLADLKGQEQSLSESISALSTASGTEAVLRTNFRVTKPGESLAVIVNREPTTTATAATETFWQKVGSWFAGLF
jgi:cytoskeletal protein RodZ